VFDDDNPEEAKQKTFHVEKPTVLLSFSNVNKGIKKINKCRDLKK
jgi:hypothetical protein